MNDMQKDNEAPADKVQPISFPWPGALGSLLFITAALLIALPELADAWSVPEAWRDARLLFPLLGICILLILLDLRRYQRQYRRQQHDILRLREQIRELWDNRRQLQLKAHTYSDHAEKLKLFISDKLLDYIEYDEKFLHFRSIAAEVRHNGVISFDKVQTALTAAEQALEAAPAEENVPLDDVREARVAMRYLWDLLDLSTADNLALHVGNLLCECEERYYQQLLEGEQEAPVPDAPVFSPRHAAWRALSLVRDERLEEPEPQSHYVLEDRHWYVQLAPTDELLGNENHLVLLLENLLKNARFFSRKRGYQGPFASVALLLHEQEGDACIRVYNRGPHIGEEAMENLFRLGYSTRRTREHHGRGLGLYFVNEIVKGYEGRIRVRNVSTPETRHTVRIELETGEVRTELVEVLMTEQGLRCRDPEGNMEDVREWVFEAPVHNLEVTTIERSGTEATRRLTGFESKGRQERLDPAHPEHPRWRLTLRPSRKSHELRFEPLDITGVEFEIRLPTARQRLEVGVQGPETDIHDEVERLDERFRSKAIQDS